MEEHQKIFIKICGITTVADMSAAVNTGIAAIGFIACPESPRYIQPEKILTICESVPDKVRKVGVFVNADPILIKRYIESGIDTIQLHGSENADYISTMKQSIDTIASSIEIWKAVKPQSKDDIQQVATLPVDKFLIDTFHKKLHGGTGKTADWNLAEFAVATLPKPVILAGGLNYENIIDALVKVRPFGVDVSSGVEKSPGIKDHCLIRMFVDRIKKITFRSDYGFGARLL